jgi:hypothetical protein
MVSLRVARAGSFIAVISLCSGSWLAACDSLVGLGPQATLQDAAAEEEVATEAASDSGSVMPEAGPEAGNEGGYPCGLIMGGSETCNNCTKENCCPVNIACAQNASCAQAAALLQDCVYNLACVNAVDQEYSDSGVLELQSCTIKNCIPQCFPGPVCGQLASCCGSIDGGAALQVCINAVNSLDDNYCQQILQDTLRAQLGAQFCAGSAPGDAASD